MRSLKAVACGATPRRDRWRPGTWCARHKSDVNSIRCLNNRSCHLYGTKFVWNVIEDINNFKGSQKKSQKNIGILNRIHKWNNAEKKLHTESSSPVLWSYSILYLYKASIPHIENIFVFFSCDISNLFTFILCFCVEKYKAEWYRTEFIFVTGIEWARFVVEVQRYIYIYRHLYFPHTERSIKIVNRRMPVLCSILKRRSSEIFAICGAGWFVVRCWQANLEEYYVGGCEMNRIHL